MRTECENYDVDNSISGWEKHAWMFLYWKKIERTLIEFRVPVKQLINSLCAGEKVNKKITDVHISKYNEGTKP